MDWNGQGGRVGPRAGAAGSQAPGRSGAQQRNAHKDDHGADAGAYSGHGGSAGDSGGGHGPGAGALRTAPGAPPGVPSISLPTGGGAIRDIGEKFAANAATGTAGLTVPVATSPGRSGFGPQLALDYDSGAGNGPFGLGWRLHLPAITRKTDRGLPRYRDDPDQDTFMLAGAEDLVPVRDERGGTWEQVPQRRREGGRDYLVQAYRPRIEGMFARIERWRDEASGESHWRSISSANVTTLYGATAQSRIADPADPQRVYSWLICESYDDVGNTSRYEYRAEDSEGVDLAQSNERNRTAESRSANRYPDRILYGNRVPRGVERHDGASDAPDASGASDAPWMFEVVFDYGDHDTAEPTPTPSRTWPCRPDPFSTYRPGFELRTYRRCHRVLMFHHFPGEPGVGADCLVSSTDLTYLDTGGSGMTTIATATHTGYRRRNDGAPGYVTAAPPPIELGYSRIVVGREPRDVDPAALENLPSGLADQDYLWIDLDGEGLAGILARQGGGWFYKANRGDGRFAPQGLEPVRPSTAVQEQHQELLDLAGDGHKDLVEFGGAMPGYYERDAEPGAQPGWQPFRPFVSRQNVPWNDPNLRMVDVDGDGLADVLVTADDAMVWFPSLAYDGFGPAERAYHPWDEEHGPQVMFSDPEHAAYLADMTGDGLSDIVQVWNGLIRYWPNLGFGRFGTCVTMDDAPWLDAPDQFDQRRVRLADIDGSGTADVVYLHPECTRVYLNRSGNAWARPFELVQSFPRLDALSNVAVLDLLGHGTACLVWSSPLPADSGRQLRYLDLMADGKPYLLTSVVNNLGAETQVHYAPSTRFYLEDLEAGRPWVTRLPFPVQVVERIETIDRISRTRFGNRYAYHHGYFDGFEREFRGFGMVERYDTEEFTVLEADDAHDRFTNLDPAALLPPVLTRTWYHTGVPPQDPAAQRVVRIYDAEYYHEPGGGDPRLPDIELPHRLRPTGREPRPWQLSDIDVREACRSLKGQVLREEVYALDGSDAEARPYVVTEHTVGIELVQPSIGRRPEGPWNYHAVLFTHPSETLSVHYERRVRDVGGVLRADPRITHQLVLDTDDYGNPLRSASAGYGRRHPDPALSREDQQAQSRLLLTVTEDGFTNAIDLPCAHRTPLPARSHGYEVVGVRPHDGSALFELDQLRRDLDAIRVELAFQDWDAGLGDGPVRPARRLVDHTYVEYRRDDLTGPLPVGVLEALALPYRSFRQAFTDSIVTDIYDGRVDADTLLAAGYLHAGDTWWLPSGETFYSPGPYDPPAAELAYARRHFFMPQRFADPFGNVSTATYDRYDLFPRRVRDALGNLVTTGDRDSEDRSTSEGIDYRVLKPWLVSDANRNRAAVAYDALARVAGTAEMGKPGQQLGDSLDGFDPDPSAEAVAAYFADPFEHTHRLLGSATSRVLYDTDAYRRTRHEPSPQPCGAATLSRETHVSDLAPGEETRVQRAFAYSDGSGHDVQHKSQTAPGPVVEGGMRVEHRWIGSGWTVFDNKGNAIRTYEPFFTASQEFEFARIVGVSSVFFYDPVSRTVATLNPDATYSKTVFDPWQQYAWDVNDTVLLDPREDPDVSGYVGAYLAGQAAAPGGWEPWYAQRVDGALGPEELAAAQKTALHADTPALTRSDSLGRTFLAVAHNRVERDGALADEFYRTRTLLDIQSNTHAIVDPLGRTVEQYQYTMTSEQAVRSGMDYGGGGMLTDVTGKIVYSWSSRGFQTRNEYDALRRPVASYVSGPGIAGDALYQRTEYGEGVADPEAANLRTRVVRQYDGAGLNTNVAYDFKGNLLQAQRQLAAEYRDVVDWSSPVPLLAPVYPGSTTYDALNRPTSMTSPDGSVVLPSYDPASLLDRVEARLRPGDDGEAAASTTDVTDTTTIVAHMEHNARGQRTLVEYGNGAHTTYDYDPLTFRLTHLRTLRIAKQLQDLRYVYDPIGNVAFQTDKARQTVYFRNQVVRPSAAYKYDAIYQLVEATGREHLGQSAAGALHPVPPSATDAPRIGLPQPGDGSAMARYRQRYAYDEVGNLLRVAHRSADASYGGWTLGYRYREASLLEPDRFGNRLTGVAPDDDIEHGVEHGRHRFAYDAQGNTTAMPPIPAMAWDPQDRLHSTARQVTNGETEPATTYYVYDSTGQRVRKATERAPGTVRHERIYLGIFEVYREYEPDGEVSLERESLHVLDDARRVALVETRTAGTDRGAARLIRYQHTDQLESAVLELDQRAQIITYEQYYPFGGTSYQSVRSSAETPKRYRFTGRERDSESGLYYHGARYYAPWLGRWTSCDPTGIADGVNTYAYVHNNPLRMVDPTGHNGVQMHFVESAAYEQVARATPTGRGFSTAMYNYYAKVRAAWGEASTAYDIGHEAAKPFWSLKAGQTAKVRLELASWNRSMGAVRDKAAKAVAQAAGQWTRTGDLDLSFTGKFKRMFWKPQPGSVPQPIVQKVAASAEWDAVAAAARRGEQLVLPGVDMAKNAVAASPQMALPFETGLKQGATVAKEAVQAELPFAKAAQGTAKAAEGTSTAAKAAEGTSAVTKAAETSSTVAKAAETSAEVANTVGKVARVAKAVAPVARVVAKVAAPLAVAATAFEVATANTTAEKANAGVDVVATAVGFAGPAGAGAAVAIVAGGAVGGKVADIVEAHGGTKTESVAAGTLSGAATGAAIGAVVGSIVPGVGTAAGAIVGGVLGGAAGFVKSYWR